jgi:superfamily II DNA/RNA helicase
MDQSDRIAEFDRFKRDEINILVASDVAARGLDVKGVSHVINFDVPWQPDDYIHRIGRTGRAGMTGIAITLAARQDAEAVAGIEKLTGLKIARSGKTPEPQAASEKAERRDAQPRREKAAPKRERAKEPAPERAQEPKRERPHEAKREPQGEPKHDPVPESKTERLQVVEDISSDWNGPLPSFLSKSAS